MSAEEIYDEECIAAARKMLERLRLPNDDLAVRIACSAFKEYAAEDDKRFDESHWRKKYHAACVDIGRMMDEAETLKGLRSAAGRHAERFGRQAARYEEVLRQIVKGDYAEGAEKAHPAVALAKQALAPTEEVIGHGGFPL